ncbi:MAG: ribonuclease III [Mariprofundaceae bacterium]|nr:ribonuclease III [Mariprofundaceae bacterium]
MHKLAACIGHAFAQPDLLQQALTHASTGKAHLERLEFLGDAVLGMVIADELYRRFPQVGEGVLTRMRAALVCRDGLLRVADAWDIGSFLSVGPGERDGEGKVRSASIAANAVEAVIGAVFLDAGWQATRAVVLRAWKKQLATVADNDGRDAKTRLQEYTQAQGWGLPEYIISDSGAGEQPRFEARCLVRGEEVGIGVGERKKTAESEAAEQACQRLNP